ncbi:MAG: BsaA family SipW-dependent biofilm matrix protein [Clostridia bacterium]|nr:BsaA family SipW-dependent biofilm matrix protein [Clostridia bacterium]
MKKEKSNKKPLIALALVALIGLIGGTIAVFTSTVNIPNIFKAATYHTETEENFKSPNDWLPGTTTDKTVIAKNTGDVEVAVRVSYEESWVSRNGADLPLVQNQGATNVTVADINFTNIDNGHWIEKEEDGKTYYYYYKRLAKNENTDSFIESVTFNEDVEVDMTCTKTTVDNKTTETCNSSGDGYDGGTYTLTIKVETVQYDQYKSYWKTTAEIE